VSNRIVSNQLVASAIPQRSDPEAHTFDPPVARFDTVRVQIELAVVELWFHSAADGARRRCYSSSNPHPRLLEALRRQLGVLKVLEADVHVLRMGVE
jgi:hypothetical protein